MIKNYFPFLGVGSSMYPNLDYYLNKYIHNKKISKCLLPECEIITDHNGGYCCKQHKQEHKAKKRAGLFGKEGK